MASQTQGIQQLLAAEKRAAEKVAEARKRKQRRLKQAKDEAQEEIERYRKERDTAFLAFERQHMGSKEDVAAKIDQETKVRIDQMNRQLAGNRNQVIDELLALVYNIEPKMHRNYAIQFDEGKDAFESGTTLSNIGIGRVPHPILKQKQTPAVSLNTSIQNPFEALSFTSPSERKQ